MDRSQMVNALRGQQYVLPDMDAVLSDWSSPINPQLAWLRVEVDGLLKWICSQRYATQKAAKVFAKLQRADFGLFGACWWPLSDQAALRAQTFFVIWLFLWDDEIDACSGDLSMDLDRADLFRRETLDFIKYSLGLQKQPFSKPSNVLIHGFDKIGAHLRRMCTFNQRQKLYDEICIFIKASEIEQRRRLGSVIPTIEEYMDCRMGTSAVGCVIAMFEACHDIQLSPRLAQSSDMGMLWNQTNTIVSIVNDIVSLKKEIADGPTDNLISLLWLSTGDLNLALSEAMTMLEEAKQDFDRTAASLYEYVSTDKEQYQRLRILIEGCKFCCTGNLLWSLNTSRYMGEQASHEVMTLS